MAETEEDLQEIQEMFEHFRFVVDKGQTPLRIDKYLSTHMENTSRHRIQLAIKQEYIRVNDTVVKANYIAKPGDVITLVMPFEKHEYEIRPENITQPQSDKQKAKKPNVPVIVYRVPAVCGIRVMDGKSVLIDTRFPVYQLGEETSIPANAKL